MKLCLFDDFIPGRIDGDGVVSLAALVPELMAAPGFYRMQGLIEAWDRVGADIAAHDGRPTPLPSVRLRAPVPRPTKLLCAQANFREGLPRTNRPVGLFLKASSCVIGPGDTVQLRHPDVAAFQHEPELALVIGKPARDVPLATAMDHVFGYTCLMDLSARGMGGFVGFADKSHDGAAPMGPWIVTADEIRDPQALQVRLWVDGELRHDYNMDDMAYPIARLIEWGSTINTLEAGDVIACGVNHQGLGPIQDGETVVMEIEQVGRLSIQVSDPHHRIWPKGIDHEMAAWVKQSLAGERPPLPSMLRGRPGYG
jgi:2-keto-4-pentenoate hydratase/2-oxohepta-3-ene-1,7-dioic acid hydratase in catechol pathway